MNELRIDAGAAAADGTASASSTGYITGHVVAIYFNLEKGAAAEVNAATKVRVETAARGVEVFGDGAGAGVDIVTSAGDSVAAEYYPRVVVHGTDGTSGSAEEKIPVLGEKITFSVAGGNDGQTATMRLFWEQA